MVRGLLNLLPAMFRRRRQPSRREGQERGCLRIGLGPVAAIGELGRSTGKRVDQREDGEAAPLPGDLVQRITSLGTLLRPVRRRAALPFAPCRQPGNYRFAFPNTAIARSGTRFLANACETREGALDSINKGFSGLFGV